MICKYKRLVLPLHLLLVTTSFSAAIAAETGGGVRGRRRRNHKPLRGSSLQDDINRKNKNELFWWKQPNVRQRQLFVERDTLPPSKIRPTPSPTISFEPSVSPTSSTLPSIVPTIIPSRVPSSPPTEFSTIGPSSGQPSTFPSSSSTTTTTTTTTTATLPSNAVPTKVPSSSSPVMISSTTPPPPSLRPTMSSSASLKNPTTTTTTTMSPTRNKSAVPSSSSSSRRPSLVFPGTLTRAPAAPPSSNNNNNNSPPSTEIPTHRPTATTTILVALANFTVSVSSALVVVKDDDDDDNNGDKNLFRNTRTTKTTTTDFWKTWLQDYLWKGLQEQQYSQDNDSTQGQQENNNSHLEAIQLNVQQQQKQQQQQANTTWIDFGGVAVFAANNDNNNSSSSSTVWINQTELHHHQMQLLQQLNNNDESHDTTRGAIQWVDPKQQDTTTNGLNDDDDDDRGMDDFKKDEDDLPLGAVLGILAACLGVIFCCCWGLFAFGRRCRHQKERGEGRVRHIPLTEDPTPQEEDEEKYIPTHRATKASKVEALAVPSFSVEELPLRAPSKEGNRSDETNNMAPPTEVPLVGSAAQVSRLPGPQSTSSVLFLGDVDELQSLSQTDETAAAAAGATEVFLATASSSPSDASLARGTFTSSTTTGSKINEHQQDEESSTGSGGSSQATPTEVEDSNHPEEPSNSTAEPDAANSLAVTEALLYGLPKSALGRNEKQDDQGRERNNGAMNPLPRHLATGGGVVAVYNVTEEHIERLGEDMTFPQLHGRDKAQPLGPPSMETDDGGSGSGLHSSNLESCEQTVEGPGGGGDAFQIENPFDTLVNRSSSTNGSGVRATELLFGTLVVRTPEKETEGHGTKEDRSSPEVAGQVYRDAPTSVNINEEGCLGSSASSKKSITGKQVEANPTTPGGCQALTDTDKITQSQNTRNSAGSNSEDDDTGSNPYLSTDDDNSSVGSRTELRSHSLDPDLELRTATSSQEESFLPSLGLPAGTGNSFASIKADYSVDHTRAKTMAASFETGYPEQPSESNTDSFLAIGESSMLLSQGEENESASSLYYSVGAELCQSFSERDEQEGEGSSFRSADADFEGYSSSGNVSTARVEVGSEMGDALYPVAGKGAKGPVPPMEDQEQTLVGEKETIRAALALNAGVGRGRTLGKNKNPINTSTNTHTLANKTMLGQLPSNNSLGGSSEDGEADSSGNLYHTAHGSASNFPAALEQGQLEEKLRPSVNSSPGLRSAEYSESSGTAVLPRTGLTDESGEHHSHVQATELMFGKLPSNDVSASSSSRETDPQSNATEKGGDSGEQESHVRATELMMGRLASNISVSTSSKGSDVGSTMGGPHPTTEGVIPPLERQQRKESEKDSTQESKPPDGDAQRLELSEALEGSLGAPALDVPAETPDASIASMKPDQDVVDGDDVDDNDDQDVVDDDDEEEEEAIHVRAKELMFGTFVTERRPSQEG